MNIFHKELGEEGEVKEWVRHGGAGRINEENQEHEGFHQGREHKQSDIEGARRDYDSRGWTMATRGGVRLGRRRRKRAMTTKRTMTKRMTTKRKRGRLDWQRKRRRRRKMTTI